MAKGLFEIVRGGLDLGSFILSEQSDCFVLLISKSCGAPAFAFFEQEKKRRFSVDLYRAATIL